MVLEKTLEIPLDSEEIKPVHPEGNQSWIFIGRTDAEAEAPILWPPDAKSWFIVKDPDAGKDRGQEEKRVTEDEMIGWHHQLNGHEFEQTLGDSEGQGSLACCSPWGWKVRYNLATEQQQHWMSSCSSIIFFFFGKVSFLLWIACAPLSENQLGTFVWASNRGFDPWVEKILWRREWQPTSVHLPGESTDRSLTSYSPWGCKESDRTELLTHTQFSSFLVITEYYSIVWIVHRLFIHSPIVRRLVVFLLLAPMKKAAVNADSFCVDIYLLSFLWG